MDKYHQRHPDKELNSEQINQVIAGSRLMTLAFSKDGEPYLATVNFAYDLHKNCFYFHCSKVGKKMEYMKENPAVWGQILEDNGYVQGECQHVYRTVQFKGKATELTDDLDIKEALIYLINQQEDDPDPVKKKNIETGKYKSAAMVRIDVKGFTGKKGQL